MLAKFFGQITLYFCWAYIYCVLSALVRAIYPYIKLQFRLLIYLSTYLFIYLIFLTNDHQTTKEIMLKGILFFLLDFGLFQSP